MYFFLHHPKILQSLPNYLLFLLRTLRLLCILRFWKIKILPHIQSTFSSYLCNVKIRYHHSRMLHHILLDFSISSFRLCTRNVQFIQFQIHLDMIVRFLLGQKNYRLDVSIKLKHIPTKSRKYKQYFYSTNTVHASPFPQIHN